MNGIRHYLLALQFFTRVPVTGRLAQWVGFSPQMLRASAAHFPGVGWIVGALGAAVFFVVERGLPGAGGAWVAAVLSTIATVLLTGAFHEDGLADVADGLGGSADRSRALEIMKDSRIGSYGAVGLMAVLGLKAAALAGLALRDFEAALLALPLAHAWSRAVPVLLLRWLRYAGDPAHAKAKPMATQASKGSVVMALFCCLIPAAVAALLGLPLQHLLAAALSALAVALAMARWLHRRLGGYTGDTLGAAQQGAELMIYLALLAALARG